MSTVETMSGVRVWLGDEELEAVEWLSVCEGDIRLDYLLPADGLMPRCGEQVRLWVLVGDQNYRTECEVTDVAREIVTGRVTLDLMRLSIVDARPQWLVDAEAAADAASSEEWVPVVYRLGEKRRGRRS